MKTSSRRLALRIASSALAAGALSALTVLAPVSAQASSTSSPTAYSTDLNARGKAVITWYGQTHASISYNNADLRADGKGAILYVMKTYTATPIVDITVAYDHVLGGAGTTDYGSVDVVTSTPTLLNSIKLRECNGGSRDNPQNCDTVEKNNPFTH